MPDSSEKELAEIEAAIGLDDNNVGGKNIPREDIIRWMSSQNIDVLGVVYFLIHEKKHYIRVLPHLTFDDYHAFQMRYFERCLREDPQSEWADSRYSAGWDIVGWFKGLWEDKSVPRGAIAELRDWLKNLYTTGSSELQRCLITATFEHLFEDRPIRKFFKDWQEDPTMRDAYNEALNYSERLDKGRE